VQKSFAEKVLIELQAEAKVSGAQQILCEPLNSLNLPWRQNWRLV